MSGCWLAQYKDIFGAPREGVHSSRIGGYAVVDLVMTFVAACVIGCVLDINILGVFIALFCLGELLHWVFCVRTEFLVRLGVV